MEKGKAILYPSPRFSAWPRSCGVCVVRSPHHAGPGTGDSEGPSVAALCVAGAPPPKQIGSTMENAGRWKNAMVTAKRKRSPRQERDPSTTTHVSNLAVYTPKNRDHDTADTASVCSVKTNQPSGHLQALEQEERALGDAADNNIGREFHEHADNT